MIDMAVKPVNRQEQKKTYFLIEMGVYFAVVYLSLHIGKIGFESVEDISNIVNHAFTHPFDVFPINMSVLSGALLLGLIPPLLIHTEFLRRRDQRPGVENGSAQWNEDLKGFYQKYTEMRVKLPGFVQEINKKVAKIPVIGWIWRAFMKWLEKTLGTVDKRPESKNMIFSQEIYMSMDTRKTRRNNNILIMGGSGTGKTRFIMDPNLLQANCSYVITDPSGELLENMGGYLRDMGYEIRVFNLVQMDHSNCYNPFHYIHSQNGVLTMLNALIKNTTPKGSSPSDPFWEKAETALLQACCFYLQSECNEEDRNFSNVMKLLRCASAVEGQEDVDSTLDILFNDLKEKDPEHIAVLSYAVFKSAGGGKTAQSILISCQTRLQTFNLDAIKNLTNTDNIDLNSIGDKKVALFCTTSINDSAFNYLVSMMYTQLFETLYFHAETECPGMRLPVHVRFLLDEFANIGEIPEFAQKLSTMRKYEISCTIVIQALSQLKSMYKDDWEVLVGNCDTAVFLGGSDATSLEYISKKLGKETIRAVNNSRSFGRQGSYSMSYNKTGRELMAPDELNVMDNMNCIVFIRGLYPFFTEKYHLEEHPNYKKSGLADPIYKFNVKETLQTGQNMLQPARDNKAVRLIEEAEIADTREAEREQRYYSRPVEMRTARGEPCFTPQPVSSLLPYSDIPEEELTEAQREERRLAGENFVFDRVHVPYRKEDQDRYAEELDQTINIHRELIKEKFPDFIAKPEDGAQDPEEGLEKDSQ